MACQRVNESSVLVFYVNGKKIVEEDPDPEETLLKYLRRKLLLTGTKSSCGQGACGACTVMVSHYQRDNDKICHFAMTSCLVPVCSLHGLSVTTVEGVGSVNSKLHPVQEQLVQAHGTQCGYCTPGFVMSMYTLLRNNSTPSMEDVNRAIKGNLCRCTGYRPILDGFKPFTKDYCPMGDQCCRRTESDPKQPQKKEGEVPVPLYNPSQEPIFPSDLQLSDVLDKQSLSFRSGYTTWLRPISLRQLLRLKAQYPKSKIVAGNTALELERQQDKHYSVLLSVSMVTEMTQIVTMETGIMIGAAVPLATIEDYVLSTLAEHSNDKKYQNLQALKAMLNDFGALQLKNMATLGGCVASAWSNSDVIPLLCALGASVQLQSYGSPQTAVVLGPEFFQGSGQTVVKDNQVIVAVSLPFLKQDQYAYSLKQSRRDFDTALISTAAVVTYNKEANVVKNIKVYFGNILPRVFFAAKLCDNLIGKPCSSDLTSDALTGLQTDLASVDGKRSLSADLRTLVEASVWKLVMQIVRDVSGFESIPVEVRQAVDKLDSGYIQGTHVYEEVPPDQSPDDSVGRPIVHRAARQQATGEALYIDDTPCYNNELFLSFVTSTKAHARILNIDSSEALMTKGVVDVLTYKDVPGKNNYGEDDEELIFAVDEVKCYGQIIAGVLATSDDVARKAAKLVDVTYETLPTILTIQEAIEAKSFFRKKYSIEYGSLEQGLSEADDVVEGEVEIGGQEHFYMETFRVLVTPMKEDNEIKVFSQTQSPQDLQRIVASALNISSNRVGIHMKRAGGGFGARESKMLVDLPAAVAAFKFKQPVRCVLDRDSDMQMTGGRNPMLAKYKIGVKRTGQITFADVDYYANAGCTPEATPIILQTTLSGFDNCYRIPNVRVRSWVCLTNLPSNTSFRGYGRPQSIYITETWIQHVATQLGLDPVMVRELNMYKVGDPLPLNSSSDTFTADRCWREVMENAKYKQKMSEIQQFNSDNKYTKRGLHVSPMMMGLQYPVNFLNQGHALVNIYLDGTVLVHHGGVELGQGLHTKVIQIASRALGNLPGDTIHVATTSTDVIPIISATACSCTTDLCGGAVKDACEKLVKRLEPFKNAKPDGKWVDWVNAAYMERTSLSATGLYKSDTEGPGYDWETGKGVGFSYYSCGAACSEVEVDILTGRHVVRRTDIVMDVGRSLNPAIDIGQIEGAFLQGYGLFCLEELDFDANGRLKTRNALDYKIPVIDNVPREFNVSLLKGSSNPKVVYSSKGIGEPPLLLASTVAMAIRQAISAYREDVNINGFFQLNSPVTPAKVRGLCPR